MDLNIDCIFLVLEKTRNDPVIKVVCSIFDILVKPKYKDHDCHFMSLSRFLFGTKIGAVKMDYPLLDYGKYVYHTFYSESLQNLRALEQS